MRTKKKIGNLYCEKCGAVLGEKIIATGRYDINTGKPTFYFRMVCPNKAEGFIGLFSYHTELREWIHSEDVDVEKEQTGDND